MEIYDPTFIEIDVTLLSWKIANGTTFVSFLALFAPKHPSCFKYETFNIHNFEIFSRVPLLEMVLS